MSGPIVRKYGFPNFDKIFGERDLQHGVDESAEAGDQAETPAATDAPAPSKAKAAKSAPKSKKKA